MILLSIVTNFKLYIKILKGGVIFMKHVIKKCFATGILSLSILISGIVFPNSKVFSLPSLTVYAAEHQAQQYGGYFQITLGEHSNTIRVTANFTQWTWVRYLNKNGAEIDAKGFNNGTHTIICPPNTYYVAIHLDDDKFAYVTWND